MANLKATRKEFEDYVNLQRDGLVNMNEMDKVLRLTRLTQESYEDIINHYDEYVNYTMRFGTNVFRGAYLHQLMRILNINFGL